MSTQDPTTPETPSVEPAQSPPSAPDAASEPAPSPAAGADLGADLAAQIDAAMDAQMQETPEPSGPNASGPGTPAAGGGSPAKPKLRGPRVVNAGREHRTGKVVSAGADDLFIEFGPKELGVAPIAQWKDTPPAVGDDVEVVIDRYEATESIYICSRPGAVQKADWELLEPGQVVEAVVTGHNKGGLELEVAGHRAFMPASQVSLDRVEDLSTFAGQKLACQVQRVERAGRGNIVLSRRDVLNAERKEKAVELRTSLNEGDVVQGTVRKIMPFGAFVDLGGADGLIHMTDLSHDRVGHGEKNIARHVQEGQEVTVKVLSLDWDNDRISLGLKQLEADPFQTAMTEVVEGAVVTGRVTKTLEFGAFVELSPGVEGLVHISELDYRRVGKVEDVVKPDEVVSVKVLKVDQDSRKISLSIKQTKEAPAPAGGGRGRGGRGDRDGRSPEEILKETPQLRRMREKAAKKGNAKGSGGLGGLGDVGGLGDGLGSLKL